MGVHVRLICVAALIRLCFISLVLFLVWLRFHPRIGTPSGVGYKRWGWVFDMGPSAIGTGVSAYTSFISIEFCIRWYPVYVSYEKGLVISGPHNLTFKF